MASRYCNVHISRRHVTTKYCKNWTLQVPGMQDKAKNTGTGNHDPVYQKMERNARSHNTDRTTRFTGSKGSQKHFHAERQTKIFKWVIFFLHPQKNKTRCSNAGGSSISWNRHISSLNLYLFGMSKSWFNMTPVVHYKNQLIATVLTKMSEFLKGIWVFTNLFFSPETQEIRHHKVHVPSPVSDTGVSEGPSQAATCATELQGHSCFLELPLEVVAIGRNMDSVLSWQNRLIKHTPVFICFFGVQL